MTSILTVCKGEGNSRLIRNPKAKLISQAVDDLVPEEYYFVILETEPPVEECAYVQVLIEREGKYSGQYLMEARYIIDGKSKHYGRHFGDAKKVKTIFQSYADGVAPNVAGWDDVTDKLNKTAG